MGLLNYKTTGEVNTARPVYDPLDDSPVTAPRPNRYNEVQNLVLANKDPGGPQGALSQTEQGVLSAALASAGQMIAQRQMTHHAAQDDTALGNAIASLVYAAAYGVGIAFVTAGLTLTVYLVAGGDEVYYGVGWLVLWGVCCLCALAYNRWQGLHYSPAGLAHHEIESRERLAMHVIDKHAAIIEKRLDIEAKANAPAPTGLRRLLG